MSERDMESLILGADHRLTDEEIKKYMKFHFRTSPLVSLFGNWLLEHPEEFEILKKRYKV